MTKRIQVESLLEFDAAPYLDSEAAIAAYLTDILAANDASLLAAALGDIARARGMAEIAKESGLTHLASGESLLAEQWISSPNDQARLMLEGNGNLMIFKLKGKPHVVRCQDRL